LDITKNRVKVYGYDAEIKFANAEELSNYLDIKKKYDLIYSFGVLHHTPNPTLAFQQVKNFMNEDSEFRLMLYHKGAFKVLQILEEYNFDYSKADIFIAKHSEAQTGCPVTYTYSKNEIIQILDSIGFEIIDLKVSHIFPYRIDEYRKYEYVKEEIWNMPDETFNEFQSRYGWHLLIKCKLKK
jgi:SAM-dependent methyltransferase